MKKQLVYQCGRNLRMNHQRVLLKGIVTVLLTAAAFVCSQAAYTEE
jgi:hypothetical protein